MNVVVVCSFFPTTMARRKSSVPSAADALVCDAVSCSVSVWPPASVPVVWLTLSHDGSVVVSMCQETGCGPE